MLSDALRLVRNHAAHLQAPSSHMPGKPLHSSPKSTSTQSRPNTRSRSRSGQRKEVWETAPRKNRRTVSFSGVDEVEEELIKSVQNDENDSIDDELVWDSFSQVEDQNLTRYWSTKTVWSGNMAEKDWHKVNLEKISDILIDDLDIPDPKRLPPDLLKARFNLAEKTKTSFRESLEYLKQFDPDFYSTVKDAKEEEKKQLRDIVKKLQTRIEDLFLESGNGSASSANNDVLNQKQTGDADVERYKRKKVCTQITSTMDRMKDIGDIFKQISDRGIDDDQQFYEAEEELKVTTTRATAILKDAEDLIDNAIEVKMVDEASKITEAVFDTKHAMDDCTVAMANLKISFGLMGGNQDNKVVNIKIPTFSGKKNDVDFLTFKKRFEEYCGLVKMSNQNQLLLLKNDCITDDNLRSSIDRLESVDEVMKTLSEQFGDIETVLWKKKNDLWKLGPMPKGERGKPGLAEKRRDWVTAVDAKLRELHQLAEHHKLEQKLYYSGITLQVESFLPGFMADEYQNQLRREKDRSDAGRQFKLMQKYLCELLDNLTFQMNRESANVHHIKAMYAAQAVNHAREDSTDYNSGRRNDDKKPQSQSHKKKNKNGANNANCSPQDCPLECGSNVRHTHLFYCEKFQQQKHFKKRFTMCAEHKICMRCLRLDSNVDFRNRELWWESHEEKCVTDFACVAESCSKRNKKAQCHILVCKMHYSTNKSREEDFKNSLDPDKLRTGAGFFTMFHNAVPPPEALFKYGDNLDKCIPDVAARAIFMVHSMTIKGKEALAFYDTGAISACVSDDALQNLESVTVKSGPTTLAVAGGEIVTVPGGHEQITLDMSDGRKAKITALHLPQVTVPFPTWELQNAWKEVVKYAGDINFKQTLPRCPPTVGGRSVDILLGIKYLSLHPQELFVLPCGLGVYRARLKCSDGMQAVLGGPHSEWEKAFQTCAAMSPMAFLSHEARAFFFQQKALRDVISVKTVEEEDDDDDDNLAATIEHPIDDEDSEPLCDGVDCVAMYLAVEKDYVANVKREFNEMEAADKIGSEVSYRCVRCRACNNCKKGDSIESTSLKEELEQALIEEGVQLDTERKKLVTTLPFVKDPVENLAPNRHIAFKVLESQERMCQKNPGMEDDLKKAHDKLLTKGFVCRVDELPQEEQKMIKKSEGSPFYIPWRSVYKESSITTPVRLVFDASARTPGKESLNGILATGRNTLADLYQLLLRFRFKKAGLSADITMAYNQIEILPDFYKYQLYLWKDDLKAKSEVVEMVVKTLIYGVRPSGNITIAGFNKVADHVIETQPEHEEGANALKKDAYMDDLATGTNDDAGAGGLASSIDATLKCGSMNVKAFTFSGQPPPPEVSTDGESVGLLGYCWFSEKDKISLAEKEVYLDKSRRGKMPEPLIEEVESNLLKKFTKRTLTRIVAAVFDPLGIAAAVTAGFKLDLHEIVELKLDWDDRIPESYLTKWVQNVEKIHEIREIQFRRAVIPQNAVNTAVQLIVSSDASEKIAMATVHASFLCKDGKKSVQLVTAKSKLVTTSTVPRAELKAAKLAASLGYVTSANAGEVERIIHVTDSVIVLHWIGQDERPLQTAVRNAVIEIRRLTELDTWHHIPGEKNIADMGTRPNKVEDISENSAWQTGLDWMYEDYDKMPLKTLEEIKLSDQEKVDADREMKKATLAAAAAESEAAAAASEAAETASPAETTAAAETAAAAGPVSTDPRITERYRFSSFIPNPASLPWPKVLRCRAAVLRFVNNLKRRKEIRKRKVHVNAKQIQFSDAEIAHAEKYFFTKATLEVKNFNDESKWKDCSEEIDGILTYKSRIVDGMKIEQHDENIFNDIDPLTFCKPLIDRWSPLAYGIMKTVHETDAGHRSTSATLLASRYVAFVLSGKDLASIIVDKCPACIKRRAKLFDAEMGKIHKNRLTIAPPFYFSQVDIFGPYQATCEHNHRSSVKVWGLIFKCTTTTAVSVHAMQRYDADAFMAALIRLGEKRGFPKKLFIDAGSQLIKGCKEANITVVDLTRPTETRFEIGIEHEVCPVSGHNMNGMAERSIKEFKIMFDRIYGGLKLDLLNYETAFSFISNEINNMPICLSSETNVNSHVDIITPARLLYGRNNHRAPADTAQLTGPTRLMEQLQEVKKAWWGVWKNELIGKFIPNVSKWAQAQRVPVVGDIVIFVKQGVEKKIGANVWHYAMIDRLITSKDGVTRRVILRYKNHNENVFHYTNRAVKSIAFICNEQEFGLMQQLKMARQAAES